MLEETSNCPARMVTDDSREWISLYVHYKAGFLAVAGGALDQPNAYMEGMRLIDSWVNKDASGS